MKKMVLCLLVLFTVYGLAFGGGGQTAGSERSNRTDINTSGYPIVTDGSVTLRYWTILNPAASKFIQSYAENPAYQEMEKRTGVKIEWIHPAISMEQEQFNLMIASGEYADIMGGSNYYRGGEFQGMSDGVYLDLTPLLPSLAPAYWKFIQEDDEFYREVSNDEGKIAAFWGYKPEQDPPFLRPVVREDVLKDLGKNVPETIADYEALFSAMQAKGIVPLLISNDSIRQFMGPYGVVPGLYKDNQEKIQYGQIQDGFRQYLTLMNDWYKKGYISRDFTSVDSNQANTLFDTKKIGMMVVPVVVAYNRGLIQNFTVVTAPYPRLTAGQVLHHQDRGWPKQTVSPASNAAVSAKSKNKEAAIRWLNYAYTPEATELMNWGVEGFNWSKVNGKNVYNDLMLNNPKFGTEEANSIYRMQFAPKYSLKDTETLSNLLKSPGSLAIRLKYSDDPNVDGDLCLPPYQHSIQEIALRTRILPEINTYVDEMMLKFITGAEDLNRFDAYVATVKSMGLQELLDMEQKAYERYLNKALK
jgi:putative aldouronate transport system substrate-binding protein